MELKMWIFYVMLLASLGECLAGYCQEEYTCMKQCTHGEKTYKKCGFAGWGRCSVYKLASHTCSDTCTRNVCCEGYTGSDCNTPTCQGSMHCRNGGTCRGPDTCSCRAGFSSPLCDDIDECQLNNGGCSHECQNMLGSYKCTCQNGYMLDTDDGSCIDIDECEDKNGGCEDGCKNTNGSSECFCSEGTLNDNMFGCSKDSLSPIDVISIVLAVVTAIAVVVFLLIRFRKNNSYDLLMRFRMNFDVCALLKGKRECILDDTDEGVTYFADDEKVEVHDQFS